MPFIRSAEHTSTCRPIPLWLLDTWRSTATFRREDFHNSATLERTSASTWTFWEGWNEWRDILAFSDDGVKEGATRCSTVRDKSVEEIRNDKKKGVGGVQCHKKSDETEGGGWGYLWYKQTDALLVQGGRRWLRVQDKNQSTQEKAEMFVTEGDPKKKQVRDPFRHLTSQVKRKRGEEGE